MKKLLLFFTLIAVSLVTRAQEVISSAGNYAEVTGVQVSWTLGETIIETVETDSKILTQGFHQSKLVVTAIDQPEGTNFDVKVYPNPTSDYVVVHFDALNSNSRFVLFDFAGKMLQQNTIVKTETKVSMENYASGTYILKLLDDQKNSIQNFKIVKY